MRFINYTLEGTVPGQVHPDLQREGLIPDPFWRDNAEQCQWPEHWEWRYKKIFDLPENFPNDWLALQFDGLDTYADIFLNGKKIGTPSPKTNKQNWGEGQEWFLTFGNDEADAVKYVQRAADMLVDSGVLFTHWWCYQSDRSQDQNDLFRMDLDTQRTPKLFQIVVDANVKLKNKYNIN
jgi:hypothetical protein